jgi:hypothetical protein
MKRTLLLALVLCSLQASSTAALAGYQQGVVVKMHMGDCVLVHRGFMSAFGPPQAATEEPCPEYTLVSDKVVFVIVGKSSNELMPLAEVVDFRFRNNELVVRGNDARRESKFVIKEMMLRRQWELAQKHIEDRLRNSHDEPEDTESVLAHQK